MLNHLSSPSTPEPTATVIAVSVNKSGKVGFDIGLDISLRDNTDSVPYHIFPTVWMKRGQSFEMVIDAVVTRVVDPDAPKPFMLQGVV